MAIVPSQRFWVCAHAKTAARIAKLQGVLRIAARKPMPRAPANPFLAEPVPAIELGTAKVNRPNMNIARMTIRIAIANMTIGILNGSPHASTLL